MNKEKRLIQVLVDEFHMFDDMAAELVGRYKSILEDQKEDKLSLQTLAVMMIKAEEGRLNVVELPQDEYFYVIEKSSEEQA
jgi:hypothetical protein